MNMSTQVLGGLLVLTGVACFLIGQEIYRPSGLSGQTRFGIFVDGDIDAGVVGARSKQRIDVTVSNPTSAEVYVYGFETTCGCLASDFQGQFLSSGEQIEVSFLLQPKNMSGTFQESIRILSSDSVLDGQGIQVSGTIKDVLRVYERPDFGIVNSEGGAIAEFQFLLKDAAQFIDEIEDTLQQNLVVHPGIVRFPMRCDWDSVACEVVNDVDVLVAGNLVIDPIAYRGRLLSASISYTFPSSFSKGTFVIPINISLIPLLTVLPGPFISKSNWGLVSTRIMRFELKPENQDVEDRIQYPQKSGQEGCLLWHVHDGGEGKDILQLSFQENSEWPSSLSIPFKIGGEEFDMILRIVD